MVTKDNEFMGMTFTSVADTFSESMRAGVRMQDETMKFWNGVLGQNTEDCRARFDRMFDLTRENADRAVKLFDDQAQKGLYLMRQGFELGTAKTPTEYFDKVNTIWRSSFDLFRNSMDSMARNTNEMISSWTNLMHTTFGGDEKLPPRKPVAPATK